MKPHYWAIFSVAALILAGCGGKSDPAALATNALTAGTTPQKVAAANKLVKLTEAGKQARSTGKGVTKEVADLEKAAVAELRRVAKESQDPEVVVVAIEGLEAAHDTDNLPLLHTHMGHANKEVREAAFKFVLRLYGGALPEKLNYQADDPQEKRAKVISRLEELQKQAIIKRTAKGGPGPGGPDQ